MKMYPNPTDGTVHIILTAREAVRLGEKLFRAAVRSGGKLEEVVHSELTEQKAEE